MKRKRKAKTSISSASAAETVANNVDLLTEILLRLPATSLLKFKCVSKQWLSLISDPQFCLSHTRLHQNPNSTPTALFLDNQLTRHPIFGLVPLRNDSVWSKFGAWKLDYLNDECQVEILQSCNGLLICCYRIWYGDVKTVIDDDDSGVLGRSNGGNSAFIYFICNPTTDQFKRVTFPSMDFRKSVLRLNLAFDPSKSPHYKIVCVRQNYFMGRYIIDIYSSEADSWSLLGINVHTANYLLEFSAIYCNGAIHWPPITLYDTSLYFDVEEECLKEMPLPSSYVDGSKKNLYFGASSGHLLLVMGQFPLVSEFDVWEMAMDYSEWSVRYHVNLESTKVAFPELVLNLQLPSCRDGFTVLSVVYAEKEEESMVVLYLKETAFAYDLFSGTSRKLCDVEPGWKFSDGTPFGYKWFNAFQHFDTLFCI